MEASTAPMAGTTPARTETLLTLAVTVLDQIAKQARFEVDYFSYY